FGAKFDRDPAFHARIDAPILAVGLLLLLQVHAPVGFRQQVFCADAVVGVHGAPNTEREDVLPANFLSHLAGEFAELVGFLAGILGRQAGSNDDEFVTAHAGHVVILAAAFFQYL